ncbi:hypothetical protein CJD36_016305 [Flavipsychrobacter stenotrophus]|uniref:ABC transporter permease n=1 Tax=Flavipsychrobacter stenotrophus TaxID=2077091 RepID=A0A2S7SUE3_9BACT|nr:ABC transporter permease [Flavipsychrobacter stenotrophus]PQJ10247.1 hypothetical protein CJD36_016305 [Flavipsychrobacter stenotrophus]
MNVSFVNSFRSEWLKRRHTASSWIVLIGAAFMPLLVILMRLQDHGKPADKIFMKNIWAAMYHRNWTAMGMFMLPFMLILSTSLITNVEFKNNTWKQLHTTPQSLTTIYFAKFSVIIVMLIQLFLLFNVGIYLSVMLPGYIFSDLQLPTDPYPYQAYFRGTGYFFIDCLPVIALQYLLSLKFKNFIVPIGIGFSMLVIALLALNWKYGYIIPYIYTPLNFKENQNFVDPLMNRHYWAAGYCVVLTVVGYILYVTKKEKG